VFTLNYIVFDLEFNSEFGKNKLKSNKEEPKIDRICPFEIIHIGAVKLDENFKMVSGFNKLVKSEIYDKINPFVEKLTGINMDQLTNAESFDIVYTEFLDFIGNDKSIFCIWGLSDIKELFRNVEYHNLNTQKLSKEYINVQLYASKYFKFPKGTNIGLSKAVELFDIHFKDSYHNAFNDACYTSEVLKKIFNNSVEICTYTYTKISKRIKIEAKTQLNEGALFSQFEKMYNRKLTEEEKSMIKLAYKMGNTNQFNMKQN
jgi:inhibitor of KinA sporulation pathway (predicted exonuclease)